MVLLSVILTRGESKSISDQSDAVPRAHTGTFSSPQSKSERDAIQGVINKWDSWGAMNRGPGEVYNYISGQVRARIDLQGLENMGGRTFERFAVQIQARTFAVIHVERGLKFGVALIRNSFEQSRDNLCHIFLTEPGVNINDPKDGNKYQHVLIQRKWDGKPHKVTIWGVAKAINDMAKKFNQI